MKTKPSIRFAAVLTLVVFLPRLGLAQDGRGGSVEGRVVDSTYARPLVGARVVAVGVDSGVAARGFATTNSKGQYRIDSLPAGRYAVGFESLLLDSLEIALSPRQVVVAPGRRATIDLALPPAEKIRGALCPGVAFPPQTGVILGHVVDSETEDPMPGVVLAMAWREVEVDRATLKPESRERTASVITDVGGWYRVCGVPTGTWLSLQLQLRGRTGPVIRAVIGDTLGVAIRHLSFAGSTLGSPVDSLAAGADSVAAPLMTGTAVLTGVVRGLGDTPLASASVGLRGTGVVDMTDATGRYTLRGLPAGSQMLDVRRLGYDPAEISVELRSGATVTRDVRVTRIVNLDSVRVVAIRSRYKEFSELKKTSPFGIVIGPEELERRRTVSFASDLIERIPGFLVSGNGILAQVVSGRGVSTFLGACRVNIIIDGLQGMAINDVPASQVGAIAAYREGEFAPPTYDKGCGAIEIWTKR